MNKKRIISEFLVGNSGTGKWISKQEAIALAEKGGLHATIVHAKQGAYLRSEYHSTPLKRLA